MKRIYFFKSNKVGNYKTYSEPMFKKLVKRAVELRVPFVCWSDIEYSTGNHKYSNRPKMQEQQVG